MTFCATHGKKTHAFIRSGGDTLFAGRVTSIAGINLSSNAGGTWSHATVPNTGSICSTARFNEPSAFGIAIDPDDPDDVYIGTNCGLAVSTDAAATWPRLEVQTPDGADTDVWDVVVHDNGIIDACGDNGHHRSTYGGGTWDASAGLPGGLCSIAVSPEEADTLFATVGTNIYESADGGDSWTNLGTPDSARQGRVPFVAVNDRTGDAFDLWFGDIRLYRGTCTINPAAGSTHCPQGG